MQHCGADLPAADKSRDDSAMHNLRKRDVSFLQSPSTAFIANAKAVHLIVSPPPYTQKISQNASFNGVDGDETSLVDHSRSCSKRRRAFEQQSPSYLHPDYQPEEHQAKESNVFPCMPQCSMVEVAMSLEEDITATETEPSTIRTIDTKTQSPPKVVEWWKLSTCNALCVPTKSTAPTATYSRSQISTTAVKGTSCTLCSFSSTTYTCKKGKNHETNAMAQKLGFPSKSLRGPETQAAVVGEPDVVGGGAGLRSDGGFRVETDRAGDGSGHDQPDQQGGCRPELAEKGAKHSHSVDPGEVVRHAERTSIAASMSFTIGAVAPMCVPKRKTR